MSKPQIALLVTLACALGVLLTCVIGVLPLVLQMVKFDAFPQDTGRRLYMPYHIEGQHPLDRVESAVNTIEAYLFENEQEFDIRSLAYQGPYLSPLLFARQPLAFPDLHP